MESERLRITLDHPDRIYFSGARIGGKIWMNVAKRTKIRAIKIEVNGKGRCKWLDILRKNPSTDEYERRLFYTSKEIYEHSETALPDFEPRGVELAPGEHTFEFCVALGRRLPSSFKGRYGSIKYKMRVLIQRPWTFDERHIIPLTVVSRVPLERCLRSYPRKIEKQITKSISLFGTRQVTMLALLPENIVVRGEPLRFCVTVINNTTTNVEKLRFSVLQNVAYNCFAPMLARKSESLVIAKKETGAVHKKSERSFAHELIIPEMTQPTEAYGTLIAISYELRVEAVLHGFFKNLVLNLPFEVNSQELLVHPRLSTQATLPPRPSDGPPDCNEASNVVYATLDSSIGSPSHSSQYSECGSLNSITSDSSAATLSPAVDGMELSYTSASQSSQFGSPSARTSLRSSNVPYMPYSSSPQMVQSYPPPHMPTCPMPESLQCALLSLTLAPPAESAETPASTPPAQASGYSQLPSTSSGAGASTSATGAASFLHSRQPPGAHELPPSYEELFGAVDISK